MLIDTTDTLLHNHNSWKARLLGKTMRRPYRSTAAVLLGFKTDMTHSRACIRDISKYSYQRILASNVFSARMQWKLFLYVSFYRLGCVGGDYYGGKVGGAGLQSERDSSPSWSPVHSNEGLLHENNNIVWNTFFTFLNEGCLYLLHKPFETFDWNRKTVLNIYLGPIGCCGHNAP